MRTLHFFVACLAICCCSNVWSADPEATVVVDGLNNPCGIAIQPETGHIFVADSGAGRIIRIVDGKAQDVITGFTADIYGKGPMYNIGPLGLVFLDANTLIVGGGDKIDGEELLRAFTIPTAGQPAMTADKADSSFALPAEGDIKGEGNFYGLAATKDSVFVTTNGDDTKGWVARAAREGNKITGYKRFLATKEATNVDAPVAATISPRGELVIGQMGEITVPNDGLVTFYNAQNGKLLMNLPTGLHDITALAYSPKGQLLATDFAWSKTDDGGLFQLNSKAENGQQSVTAKKILALDKATAMAFGGDGSLYITVVGTAAEGSTAPAGKLLKVAAGL